MGKDYSIFSRKRPAQSRSSALAVKFFQFSTLCLRVAIPRKSQLSIDKTPAIVSEFMQAHIVSKAPAGWQQFGLGFLSSYVEGGVKQMLARNAAFLTTFGIVDDKGIVDMDKAYTAAVQQLERSGGKVMFNGIIFGRSDLDALLEISRKYGA